MTRKAAMWLGATVLAFLASWLAGFFEAVLPTQESVACKLGLGSCPPGMSAIEPGSNRPGNNEGGRKLYLSSPEKCSAECLEDEMCKSWTMRIHPNKANMQCWLKDSIADIEPHEDTVSGYKIDESSMVSNMTLTAPCPENFKKYEKTTFRFECECTRQLLGTGLTGTNVYTSDSNICLAAKHAGLLESPTQSIEVQGRPPCDSYQGSVRNGIGSLEHKGAYYWAFYFPAVSDGSCN